MHYNSPSKGEMDTEFKALLSQDEELPTKVDKSKEEISPIDRKRKYSFWRSLSLRQKLILIFAAAGPIIIYLCQSIPGPFLARVVEQKGGESFYAAAIMHFTYLFSALASLVCGKYQSHTPTKKFISTGLLLVAVSQGALGFLKYVEDVNVFLVVGILMKAVQGIGQGFFNVALLTLLWNEIPEHLEKSFGLTRSFTCIGFVLGPLLGGYLYEIQQDIMIPFLLSSVFPLLLSVIAWISLPELENSEDEADLNAWRYIIDPKCVFVLGLCATCAGLFAIFDASFTAYAQSLGIRVVVVGAIMSVADTFSAVSNMIAGYFADVNLVCRRTSIVLCFLTVAGVNFAFNSEQTAGLLYLEVSVSAISVTAIQTLGFVDMAHEAASQNEKLKTKFNFRSKLSGVWYFVISLCTFAVGLLGTGLQTWFTYSLSLTVCTLGGLALSIFIALSTVLWIAAVKE